MSEKKPRELYLAKGNPLDSCPDLHAYSSEPIWAKECIHVREVIEQDERDARIKDLEWFIEQVNAHVCPGVADTKDAALIALRKRDAEIAKLREALKVAREGLEYSKRKQQPVEMEAEKWVLLDYINYTIRNSNEALTRIRYILGEKEGGQ